MPSLGIDPRSPTWKSRALPLDYGTLDEADMIKSYCYCQRVWQKGPPPGSQAYKIYVGSNRVKTWHTLSQSTYIGLHMNAYHYKAWVLHMLTLIISALFYP